MSEKKLGNLVVTLGLEEYVDIALPGGGTARVKFIKRNPDGRIRLAMKFPKEYSILRSTAIVREKKGVEDAA